MKTELGKAIKYHREKRGMSLQTVADEAGVSKNHVWDMERGASRNPTIETLLNVALAIGAEPGALALTAMASLPGSKRVQR